MATNKKESLADKGKKAVGKVVNKAEKAVDDLKDKHTDSRRTGTKK